MTNRKFSQEIVSHRRKIQWCIRDIEFEMFQIHLFSNCNHLKLKLKWVILVTHFQQLWLIVHDSILWLIDMSNTVWIISVRLAPFHLRTYLLAFSFAFRFQKCVCPRSRLKIQMIWVISYDSSFLSHQLSCTAVQAVPYEQDWVANLDFLIGQNRVEILGHQW